MCVVVFIMILFSSCFFLCFAECTYDVYVLYVYCVNVSSLFSYIYIYIYLLMVLVLLLDPFFNVFYNIILIHRHTNIQIDLVDVVIWLLLLFKCFAVVVIFVYFSFCSILLCCSVVFSHSLSLYVRLGFFEVCFPQLNFFSTLLFSVSRRL